MSKIIIPNNLIITKGSLSTLNVNISPAEYKKYEMAFSKAENEYILNIQPQSNRTIKHAVLTENCLSTIDPIGKLTMNINKINSYLINFKSNKLKLVNNYYQFYQGPYLEQIDFVSCKEWEINANNLEFNLDIEHINSADSDEITFYKRDLLPLENLTINCNEARICIQNQDIKKLYINVKDSHEFVLILKNLFKLEYLDISNVKRLDLKKYQYDNLKSKFSGTLGMINFYHKINEDNIVEEAPINYFNLDCINGDCILKLNSDLCFYFISKSPIKNSAVLKSIPLSPKSYENNYWYCFYLAHIIDCKNKKYIEIKWKDLQKKIISKTNQLIQENVIKDSKSIEKKLKNCQYPEIKKEG